MAKINLNSSPYFDDYSEAKHFLKILHAGGGVQRRELNQAQTILQKQVTRMGDHFFENGAMVKPGQLTYDGSYSYVKLQDPISQPTIAALDPANVTNVGKTLFVSGSSSGIKAQILSLVEEEGSEPTTIFVKYLNSGTDGVTKTFNDNELLSLSTSDGPIAISNVKTALSNATGLGSAVNIQEGIYYINGFFVLVEDQSIILNKYSNTPSVRVGLDVNETIVTADQDPSLFENSSGFENKTAPGAHRYKIDLVLSKRDLASTDDTDFIELLRLEEGEKKKLVTKTDYSLIEKTLAERTYDENGDYTVTPFKMSVREHLNTGTNLGVYTQDNGGDQTKLVLQLEPAKAYVRGYEIETIANTLITIDKARTSLQENNFSIRVNPSNYVLVDRVFNMPQYDGNAVKVTLYDTAIQTNGSIPVGGNIVGTAYVKGFEYFAGNLADGATGGSGAPKYPMFKSFLYNISLNAGKTIDDVGSMYLAGVAPFTANVLAMVQIRNQPSSVSNVTFGDGALTGGGGSEDLVWGNISTGIYYTRRTSVNCPIGSYVGEVKAGPQFYEMGILASRTKVFDVATPLIYPVGRQTVKSVTTNDGVSSDTTYEFRRTFTAALGSPGLVSFSAPSGSTFSAFSTIDYLLFVNGQSVDLSSLNYSFQSANTVFQIANCPAGSIVLSATLRKQQATAKTKTLVTTTINVAYPAPATISLGQADIYKLISVVDRTSGANITSRYTLDNGQRDFVYDIGSISLKKGEINSLDTAGIAITFQYFTHSLNGDYFCVDSYANFGSLPDWYDNVPTYQSKTSGKLFDLRDSLDFRPRLNTSGGLAIVPLAPKYNSDILADFSYYVPRIDKLYLNWKGEFLLQKGNPSAQPAPPEDPKDGMVLYQLRLGAYTFGPQDIAVKFIENKRYTQRDIGALEKRLENVEYYTALNLTEQQTANLKIIDSVTGIDRFKNGFIVDNFTGHQVGDPFNRDYKCSIDAANRKMRPMFSSKAVDVDLDMTNSSNVEYRTIKPKNDLLTCKYAEVKFIEQPYASRVENVNPYAIYSWIGSIALSPSSDYWKDTERRPDVLVNDDSAFDSLLYLQDAKNAMGTVWDEWRTDWTGVSQETVNTTFNDPIRVVGVSDSGERTVRIADGTSRTITTTTERQTRTGYTSAIVPKVVKTLVADRVVNVAFVPYIRSRYIKFEAKRLKPNTRYYPYFDHVNVDTYCKPADPNQPDNHYLPNEIGMTLDQRALISDGVGNLNGWFNIPNSDYLRFLSGRRIFRLTDDEDNTSLATSFAEAAYDAQGALETVQSTITSVRQPSFERKTVTDTRVIQNRSVGEEVVNYVDPLAQTFLVSDMNGGIMLTGIDLFFNIKDDTLPVTVQIREVVGGYPTQKIVPFSEVTLNPSNVNVPDSTGVPRATRFSFQSPVYLQNGQEYAFVILSNSNNYEVFTSRLGEKMIKSDRIISQQPYAGSMFISQNASTWTAVQLDDIMFTLYRASFDTTTPAEVVLTNRSLSAFLLGSLPFMTSAGSSLIRVFKENHGLFNGAKLVLGIPSSELTANGTGAVYNGINVNSFMSGSTDDGGGYNIKIFTVQNATLDTFMIDAGTLASASGRVGPNNVVLYGNIKMDLLYLVSQQLIFGNTNIDWSIKATNLNFVKDASFSAITANSNMEFTSPKVICSQVNEDNMISGFNTFERKSLVLKATLTTAAENISPVIDSGRIGGIVVSNLIDNNSVATTLINGFDDFNEMEITGTDISFVAPNVINSVSSDFSKLYPDQYIGVAGSVANNTTFPNLFKIVSVSAHSLTVEPISGSIVNGTAGPSVTIKPYMNYVADTGSVGTFNPSNYIIRKITLKDPATILRVYATLSLPNPAIVDIYYRILGADSYDSLENQRWVKLPYIGGQSINSSSSGEFKEYIWEQTGLSKFTYAAIKVVMRSADTTKVPVFKDDIRMLALS